MNKAHGHIVRLKNRRVFLGKDPEVEGEFLLQFKSLINAKDRKERIQETSLRLSDAAMHALAGMYFRHHVKL